MENGLYILPGKYRLKVAPVHTKDLLVNDRGNWQIATGMEIWSWDFFGEI